MQPSAASWAAELAKLFEPRHIVEATMSAVTTAAASATASPAAGVISKSTRIPSSLPQFLTYLVNFILFTALYSVVSAIYFRLVLELCCQYRHDTSFNSWKVTAQLEMLAVEVLCSMRVTLPMRFGWRIGGWITDAVMYIPRLNLEMEAQRKMITTLTKLHEEEASASKTSNDFLVWRSDKAATDLKRLRAEMDALKTEQSTNPSIPLVLETIETLEQFAIESCNQTNTLVARVNDLQIWAKKTSMWGNYVDEKMVLNSQHLIVAEKRVEDGFIWEQDKQATAAKELAEYKSSTAKRIHDMEIAQKRLDIMNDWVVEIIDEEDKEDDARFDAIHVRLDGMSQGSVLLSNNKNNNNDDDDAIVENNFAKLEKKVDDLEETVKRTCLGLVDVVYDDIERLDKNVKALNKKVDKKITNIYQTIVHSFEGTKTEFETLRENIEGLKKSVDICIEMLDEKVDKLEENINSDIEHNHQLYRDAFMMICRKLVEHKQKIEDGFMWEHNKQVTVAQDLLAFKAELYETMGTDIELAHGMLCDRVDELTEDLDDILGEVEKKVDKLTGKAELVEAQEFQWAMENRMREQELEDGFEKVDAEVKAEEEETGEETMVEGDRKEMKKLTPLEILVEVVTKIEFESDSEDEFENIEADSEAEV